MAGPLDYHVRRIHWPAPYGVGVHLLGAGATEFKVCTHTTEVVFHKVRTGVTCRVIFVNRGRSRDPPMSRSQGKNKVSKIRWKAMQEIYKAHTGSLPAMIQWSFTRSSSSFKSSQASRPVWCSKKSTASCYRVSQKIN